MAFIRYKQRGQRWYVYEVSNVWNKKLKKYKQSNVYLGVASEKGGEYKKQKLLQKTPTEKEILDFGDSYAISKIIETCGLSKIIKKTLGNLDTISSLICYQLTNGSAMYNCFDWFTGNIANKLFPQSSLRSQSLSRLINKLGKEEIQRKFFKSYIEFFFQDKHGILIDSTALPSAINGSLNTWGYAASGVEMKTGCLMLVDKKSKLPIFFRTIPGDIADVSTLKNTFDEIKRLGLKTDQAIFDAGYFSEANLQYLCENDINFISIMPKSRKIFKKLVLEMKNIEIGNNAVQYGKRAVFINSQELNLYGHRCFAHIILDPDKKAKDVNKLILDSFANPSETINIDETMKYCGFFILVSRHQLKREEVLPNYYTRQTIEQVFGFAKVNNLLPLRVHSDQSINGYLLLVFLSIVVFILMRQKLQPKITVEQSLLVLRNLKAKIYEKDIIPLEISKKAKDIFKNLNIKMPISWGI